MAIQAAAVAVAQLMQGAGAAAPAAAAATAAAALRGAPLLAALFPPSAAAYSTAAAPAPPVGAAAACGDTAPLLSYEETYIDARTLTAVDPPPAEAAAGGRGPLTAVFLHGLLGSGKNWRSFSKGLAVQAARETRRDVRSLLVDLRAHGRSSEVPGLHPPHTIEAAGADVVRTLRAALGGAPHVLVGLSLGGKVALDVLGQLEREQRAHCGGGGAAAAGSKLGAGVPAAAAAGGAAAAPGAAAAGGAPPPQEPPGAAHRALPLHCWVLDSQPGAVRSEEDSPTSVARILALVARTPMPLPSRQALLEALDAEGLPRAVAWWLSSGLVPAAPGAAAGAVRWGFDAAGAAALYHSYRHACYWSALERPPPGVTLHVVRGQRSDRWTPEMLARLEAARAAWQAAEVREGDGVGRLRLHVLPNAGHWLQADNPQGLQAMMVPWFRDEPGV